jgi:hypothetical protein
MSDQTNFCKNTQNHLTKVHKNIINICEPKELQRGGLAIFP